MSDVRNIRQLILAAGLCLAADSAHANGAATYWADPNKTASQSFGSTLTGQGDRELTKMGFKQSTGSFAASSTTFNDSNYLNFTDGYLKNNTVGNKSYGTDTGLYGWGDAISRDTTSANKYTFNPDRADGGTEYGTYGNNTATTGTLSQVFGGFDYKARTGNNYRTNTSTTVSTTEASTYKNMGYLLDGEDVPKNETDKTKQSYYVDLLFGHGKTLSADNSDKTVEVSILERGGNSSFDVYGIQNGVVKTGLKIHVDSQDSKTKKIWALDSLEIGSDQSVVGYGLSLDSSWSNLDGFRIEGVAGDNGPDIVAVGTADPIPEPAFYQMSAFLTGGGLLALRLRKRKTA